MNRVSRIAAELSAGRLIAFPDEGTQRKIALEQIKYRIQLPTREFMHDVARDILNAFGALAEKNGLFISEVMGESETVPYVSFGKKKKDTSFDWTVEYDVFLNNRKLRPIGIRFDLVDNRVSWDKIGGSVRAYFLPWTDDIDVKKIAHDLWTYIHMKVASKMKTASSGQLLPSNRINLNEVFKRQLKERIRPPSLAEMNDMRTKIIESLNNLMVKDGMTTDMSGNFNQNFPSSPKHGMINYKDHEKERDWKLVRGGFYNEFKNEPVHLSFRVGEISNLARQSFVPWEEDLDPDVIARLLFQDVRFDRMKKR